LLKSSDCWVIALKPKLAVHAFDVDNTLLGSVAEMEGLQSRGFKCGALLKHFTDNGKCKEKFFAQFESIAQTYREGTVDYAVSATKLVQVLADAFKGMDVGQVEAEADEFSRDYVQRAAFDFVKPLFLSLKEGTAGVPGFIILVSASTEFVMPAAVRGLGADCGFGTVLEQKGGKYTGKILFNLAAPKEKSKALATKIGELQNQFEVVPGVGGGDSFDDISMALDNGLAPIAFGERLQKQAAEKRWTWVNPEKQPSQKIIEAIRRGLSSK